MIHEYMIIYFQTNRKFKKKTQPNQDKISVSNKIQSLLFS